MARVMIEVGNADEFPVYVTESGGLGWVILNGLSLEGFILSQSGATANEMAVHLSYQNKAQGYRLQETLQDAADKLSILLAKAEQTN